MMPLTTRPESSSLMIINRRRSNRSHSQPASGEASRVGSSPASMIPLDWPMPPEPRNTIRAYTAIMVIQLPTLLTDSATPRMSRAGSTRAGDFSDMVQPPLII